MRVPADLVGVVGRKEVTRSLATKDPAEAKRRFAEVRAHFDEHWANLRDRGRVLTEREAHELALPFHDAWLAAHRDYPSRQTFWDTKVGATLWSRRDEDAETLSIDLGFDPGPLWIPPLRFSGHRRLEKCGLEQATAFLTSKACRPRITTRP